MVGCNLADLSRHETVFQRVIEEFDHLYVLAHLAAVLRRRSDIDQVTEADWDVQLDTNLKATYFLSCATARFMKVRGCGGRIINFSSQGWWTGGYGGSLVYSASKGGIVSMERGLPRTYAPDGILVNVVSPGLVDTTMMRGGMSEEALKALVKQIPLGRIATPDELTGTVLFLASDHASYITGATINVSGGFMVY